MNDRHALIAAVAGFAISLVLGLYWLTQPHHHFRALGVLDVAAICGVMSLVFVYRVLVPADDRLVLPQSLPVPVAGSVAGLGLVVTSLLYAEQLKVVGWVMDQVGVILFLVSVVTIKRRRDARRLAETQG